MTPVKKIAIFGATGNTGLCCLQSALDLGYNVTVLVRDPQKVPEEHKSRIQIIVGDTNNTEDVEKGIEGQDGVVIALGTRTDLGPTTVMSNGTKNIISAMNKHGIRRVSACISAFLFWERARVPERFLHLTEDHERMLKCLSATSLDWVIVNPPHIASEPPTGRSPIIAEGKSPNEGRTISKYDLGKFLVNALSKEEYYGKVLGICDRPAQ